MQKTAVFGSVQACQSELVEEGLLTNLFSSIVSNGVGFQDLSLFLRAVEPWRPVGLTEHFEARKRVVSWLHRCAGGIRHCSVCTVNRFRMLSSTVRLRC